MQDNSNKRYPHTHTHTAYDNDIPILARFYEFYKDLTTTLTTFPKVKRYTLGQKLDTITLDMIELLFSIPYTKDKTATLQSISTKLDLLKVLLRLSKDTQALTDKKYLELQTVLQEVGKMLGGWIRSAKQNPL